MTDHSDDNRSLTPNRRSFLGAAGLTIAGVGFSTQTVTATDPTGTTDVGTVSQLSPQAASYYYELEHKQTGTAKQYAELSEIDLDDFSESGDALLRTIDPETDETISVDTVQIPETTIETTDTDKEVSITPAVEPNSAVVDGEEIDFYVSAVDASDRTPIEDETLEIEITDDDGDTVATYTVETDADGSAVVVHDAEARDTSQRQASVTIPDEQTSRTVTYYVGERYQFAPLSGAAAVGEPVSVGIFATEGDEPIEEGSVEVEIEPADDDDDERTETVSIEDGVGILEITPETPGFYRIRTPTDSTTGMVQSVQAIITNSVRGIQNQQSSDSLVIAGQIVDGQTPLTNEAIVVTVHADGSEEEFTQIETTTGDGGQFIAEFEHEAGTEDYEYSIALDDGTNVFHRQSRISIQREVSVDPDPVNPDIAFDEFSYSATDEVTASIVVSDEDDEPIDDISGTVSWEIGIRGPRIASSSFTTDDSGEATASLDLSDLTIDNHRLYAYVSVTEDDERYTADDSVDVSSVQIDQRTRTSPPGETSELELTLSDAASEEAIEDVPITLFASQSDLYSGIAATATGQTDSNGEVVLSYDIDEDVPVRTVAWYDAPSSPINSGTSGSDGPIEISVETSTSNPEPGEEITVEVNASGDDGLTLLALSSFNYFVEAQTPSLDDEFTVTVPEAGISDGDWGRVQALVLSENGAYDTEQAFLTVDGDGEEEEEEEVPPPDADFAVRPSEPIATQTIRFDASDTEPADRIQSYEWEFGDADESTDTGERVRFSYDESGDYTVSLVVTDVDGETDTKTKTVSVDPQPESAEDYADEGSENVESGGVRDAFGHWGSGGIDRDLLREVFAEWQSGDSSDDD